MEGLYLHSTGQVQCETKKVSHSVPLTYHCTSKEKPRYTLSCGTVFLQVPRDMWSMVTPICLDVKVKC